MSLYDLIVVGGGAAGLSAAFCAAEKGDRVLILEAGPAIGRKILASGNGRCNLMNSGPLRYYGDSRFAEEVLSAAPAALQKQFWHHLGLFLSEEKDGRIYPCTFQSSSVLLALKTGLNLNGVSIVLQAPVKNIVRSHESFILRTGADTFSAARVILATGGPAHPRLGGNESGASLLEDFGVGFLPFRPALSPLITDRKSISGLFGTRVHCTVSLLDAKQRLLHREKGEVLFTDYGISGICAMQCARFLEESCTLELDFAERIFPEGDSLPGELRYRRERFSSAPAESLFHGILVPKLSFAVLKQAGFPLRGETLGTITDDLLARAAHSIRHYRLSVLSSKGMEEAQVSAGGADCSLIDPKTMEYRMIPGIHAAGELLNVDGDCGGFNLMFAFATGILAGLNGRKPAFVTGG